MVDTPGFWQRFQIRLGRFWRRACRPWLTRRNIPYFVLLALIGFVLATGGDRKRAPADKAAGTVETEPAAAAVKTEEPAIRLAQSAQEAGAAWEAAVAAGAGREEAAFAEPALVEPSAFVLPARGRLVTGRGWRKADPGGIWVYHAGVDLETAGDEAVLVLAAGRVASVGPHEEGGEAVEIDHGQGWRSVYGRLEQVGVETGGTVAAGQALGVPIAGVIHLEIWRDGKTVDPLTILPGLTGD